MTPVPWLVVDVYAEDSSIPPVNEVPVRLYSIFESEP